MDNCFTLVTAYVVQNDYGHRLHLLGTLTYVAHSEMLTLQSSNFMQSIQEFCVITRSKLSVLIVPYL